MRIHAGPGCATLRYTGPVALGSSFRLSRQSWRPPAFHSNADPELPCRIRIRNPALHCYRCPRYLLLLGVGNLGHLQLFTPKRIRIQLPKIMRIHAGSRIRDWIRCSRYLLLLGVGNLGHLQLFIPMRIRIQRHKLIGIHAGSGSATLRYTRPPAGVGNLGHPQIFTPMRIRIQIPKIMRIHAVSGSALLSYLFLLGVGNLGHLQLFTQSGSGSNFQKIMRIHAGSGSALLSVPLSAWSRQSWRPPASPRPAAGCSDPPPPLPPTHSQCIQSSAF
jgi:hypothetical protein